MDGGQAYLCEWPRLGYKANVHRPGGGTRQQDGAPTRCLANNLTRSRPTASRRNHTPSINHTAKLNTLSSSRPIAMASILSNPDTNSPVVF